MNGHAVLSKRSGPRCEEVKSRSTYAKYIISSREFIWVVDRACQKYTVRGSIDHRRQLPAEKIKLSSNTWEDIRKLAGIRFALVRVHQFDIINALYIHLLRLKSSFVYYLFCQVLLARIGIS